MEGDGGFARTTFLGEDRDRLHVGASAVLHVYMCTCRNVVTATCAWKHDGIGEEAREKFSSLSSNICYSPCTILSLKRL
jgi:hypothetical protein